VQVLTQAGKAPETDLKGPLADRLPALKEQLISHVAIRLRNAGGVSQHDGQEEDPQ
jgi:hypothetical protein